MYQNLAILSNGQQRYQDAVLYASAALESFQPTNEYGNVQPELVKLRAGAFERSDNVMMAMEDYKTLYATGQSWAQDSMKRLFPQYNTDHVRTFPEFLAELQSKEHPTSGSRDMAPDFSAIDLQGHVVSLRDLVGKVVVLNFWRLGCGPCIREMPELDKMVARYRDSGDVEFLAIAGDDTQSLTTFLEHHQFSYTVVNQSPGVWKDYHIASLPVHIVIGKDGHIVTKFTGAQEHIGMLISQAIDRAR